MAGVAAKGHDPRLDKALKYRQRQLSIYEAAFSKDDPFLAETVRELAEIYAALGDSATAKRLTDRELSLLNAKQVWQSEEEMVKYEVRQSRLLLRFDEADQRAEMYRTTHPGSMLKVQ